MITPITFTAVRGASVRLFAAEFLHTAVVVVVVLQAPDAPWWVFGEMANQCCRLYMLDALYHCSVFLLFIQVKTYVIHFSAVNSKHVNKGKLILKRKII